MRIILVVLSVIFITGCKSWFNHNNLEEIQDIEENDNYVPWWVNN